MKCGLWLVLERFLRLNYKLASGGKLANRELELEGRFCGVVEP
jgi:hypothetical protein